ncbi:C10 family peptidase [bacterium]|nr:C10 family peptidase [bacterium]
MRKKYKQKQKYLIPWFLVCIAGVLTLHAEKLSEQDIKTAVQTWVQVVTADARPDAVIESMEPFVTEGETLAYIAHISDSGFCLCGADNMLYPVYYYNPHNSFDANNPNYKYILEEITVRTDSYKAGISAEDTLVLKYAEEFESRVALWRTLVEGTIPPLITGDESPLADPDRMSILFNSKWGQHWPFWHYCPTLTHNPVEPDTTVVGCVATALAQIIYYWEWPPQGTGTVDTDYLFRWSNLWLKQALADDPGIDTTGDFRNRLRWAGDTLEMRGKWDYSLYESAQYIDTTAEYLAALSNLWNGMNADSAHLEVNLEAHSYNYDIMLDQPEAFYPSNSNLEMAKLSYHTGLAVDMSYGINSSSSLTSNVPEFIINQFDYDPDAHYIDIDIDSMTNEIIWSRPVQIRGSSSAAGGHSWVVFGYNKATDPNRQFRMNMGWDGSDDGWYTLDNVPLDLINSHAHNIFVAPENVVRFVGTSGSPGDGSPNNPHGSFTEGLDGVDDGGTLVFKANSVHYYPADSAINQEVTLKGYNIEIRAAAP